MRKESHIDQQYIEPKPSIGGFGIFDDLDGGFERKPFTIDEELKIANAFGIGIESDHVEDGFVLIQATLEQEEIHKRVIAAHSYQMEGADAVSGSIFDLPQDKFGLADPAREDRVIFKFDPREYKKNINI